MGSALLAEPSAATDIAHLAINTIRTLSIDAVEQAKSGHPGTPMALAPLVYTLWNRSCNSIRRIRSSRTATALCYRTGTPPCCSGQCSILRGPGR